MSILRRRSSFAYFVNRTSPLLMFWLFNFLININSIGIRVFKTLKISVLCKKKTGHLISNEIYTITFIYQYIMTVGVFSS